MRGCAQQTERSVGAFSPPPQGVGNPGNVDNATLNISSLREDRSTKCTPGKNAKNTTVCDYTTFNRAVPLFRAV